MKLIFEYTKNYCKQMLRNPSALFFTLFFPAILITFFGGDAQANDTVSKLYSYIIYCNFAVQTVMLQTLGITAANDRASEWTRYLKTLPTTMWPSIVARILSNLFFAMISLGLVTITNVMLHPLHIPFQQYVIIMSCALLGGIPMAMLALLLARFLNPVAARGGFVLINTLLLFTTLALVKADPLSAFFTWLPTQQWLLLSLSALNFANGFVQHLVILAGYAVLFYVVLQQSERLIKR